MPERLPCRGYIALGSNLGDRRALIADALAAMRSVPGLKVLRQSRLVESRADGFDSEHLFLNAVAEVEWQGEPLALLEALQGIEASLGRHRPEQDAPSRETAPTDRTIDLDIIWLDGISLAGPRLTIPHPQAGRRGFVLGPLADLNPALAEELRRNPSFCGNGRAITPSQ